MEIIPTMDIQDGYVVQRRPGPQKYRKLESVLVNSAEPVSVLRAIRGKLGCSTFYVTDLNARHRQGNNFKIINDMSKLRGVRLLIDAGVSTPELGQKLMQIGSTKVVVGTKHLTNMKETLRIIETIGLNNVLFTVETEQYQPYADSADIKKMDPIELISQLRAWGLEEFVVIELSNIGKASGIPSSFLEFLRKILEKCSGVRIITGGGIRDLQDIVKLINLGISRCLVGTALHSGTITAEDIHSLCK